MELKLSLQYCRIRRRQLIRKSSICVLAVAATCSCWLAETRVYGADPAENAREAMLQRVVEKLERTDTKDLQSLGFLTGLWRCEGPLRPGESNILMILHIKDVLAYYWVDPQTGEISTTGLAERQGNNWRGWWSLICRDCCPGVTWWDQGIFHVLPKQGARIDIRSFKMDHNTCELTDTPDRIELRLQPVRALRFVEHLPGKLIHMVAAPQVGNQLAQYKASVKLGWDLRGTGVSQVSIAVIGQMLVANSRQVSGEYEFVTDRPGRRNFFWLDTIKRVKRFISSSKPLRSRPSGSGRIARILLRLKTHHNINTKQP